jgi:O-antigen ligase
MKEKFITYKQQIMLFFLWLCVVALFLIDSAPAISSIAMIGFTITGLFSAKPKNWIKNLVFNKSLLYLIFSFLVIIPSVLYSVNLKYFALRVQILIPFLVMPFAYAQTKEFSLNQKKVISYTFILGVLVTAIQALIYYYNHQIEVNQAYLESRVMPTAISHHPTYSLMCAFSIYLLYNVFKEENNINLKFFLVVVTIFLVVFLHIFSVRAGLMAFYILVILIFYEQIFLKKQYTLAIFTFILCVAIAVSTFLFSPTIRNKIVNTQTDIENYKAGGSANNQSLGSRIISYKNAIEVTNNTSWIFGCGLGDIEDLNNQLFEIKYPDVIKKIIPHNQFLYYLASVGILGLLIFVVTFYYPLFIHFKNLNLVAHYLLMTAAFLIEAFLTTQLGVAFCIIFLLLYINKEKEICL